MIAALAVTAVAALLFGAETIVIAGDTRPTGLDTRVLEAAEDLNGGGGVAIAKLVTALGTLPVTAIAALVTAVLLVRAGRGADAAMLAASVMAIYIAVHVTKAATGRPRPPDPVVHASLSAFPSGHAAYSTIYVAVALLARKGAAVTAAAIALALAIGASRVYLRVHWATDVLAGWALGAAIFGAAAAIALVVGRFRNNDARTVPWP
jgi:membrane-associated phospholipid phosphatase